MSDARSTPKSVTRPFCAAKAESGRIGKVEGTFTPVSGADVAFVSIVPGADKGLTGDAAGKDGKGGELKRVVAGSGAKPITPLFGPTTAERLMALRDAIAGCKAAVAVPVVLNSRRKKMFSRPPGVPSGIAQTATKSLPAAANPS